MNNTFSTNVNNTFSTNGSGTFVNNASQSMNQSFMNNNINQPGNPPYNQTFTNNNFDSNNNLNQNNFNNINTTNYVPNNNGKNNNKTKKIIMISAIVLGIVVVILVLISLLSKSPKTSIPSVPNAQKTLTCTTNVAMFGVYYDETYEYYINDDSVSLKQTRKMDLKKTQVEGEESEWVQSQIDGMSEECNSTSGCKFDYKYSKGNYLETTIFYGEELLNEAVQGLTAEEIYSRQKVKHETGKIDGLIYTCSGNGTASTDTNNQSVYKTIDFNSYTGDSKSTEFDILINKKVTFTNVPTLGGSLGTLTKNISCRGESSFTIEDDAKYTVTGIVINNNGTYLVILKDCTITKN